MDKFALEEKVRTMEGKVKEANKRAEEAERQAGVAKQGLHSIETIWLEFRLQKWLDILLYFREMSKIPILKLF